MCALVRIIPRESMITPLPESGSKLPANREVQIIFTVASLVVLFMLSQLTGGFCGVGVGEVAKSGSLLVGKAEETGTVEGFAGVFLV